MTTSGRPALDLPTKGLYGLGSIATGVLTRSLNAFLLLFYSQVLGLPAATVAGVIMLVTFFDAAVDPLVGLASDNTRTRWGRRHAFMYAAAVPTAAAFALLWAPPASLGEAQLAAWLLVCMLVIRFSDTLYELPSMSLAPELTQDYAERSVLIAARKGFEMAGGYLFVMAGYQVFMRERPDGSGGLTAPDGYLTFGLAGATLVFIAILVSTHGTQKFVPWLAAPPRRSISAAAFIREVRETLGARTFLIMAAAGMLYSTAVGITQALSIYFNLFFWELSQAQVALIVTVQIPASFLAVVLAPLAVRRFGKKVATIVSTMIGVTVVVTPVTLRLLGLMPPNGDPIVYGALLTEAVLSQIFLLVGVVIIPSMLADVVEDREVKTGRRSEGLIFAGENFARKAVSGVGVFIAGVVLTLIDFPRQAKPGTVSAEALNNLGVLWVSCTFGILTASMLCIAFFPIDRRRHEDNLRILQRT